MPNVTYAKGYDVSTGMTDDALLAEAVKAAKGAEAAVLFVGLPVSYESEGFDRKHIDLPPGHVALIEAVCAAQPNAVVALHNGSAVSMPWADQVPAILDMHLGGEAVGGATVRLLFGDAVPSGKLAETFPLRLVDNPSYLNFPGHNGRVEYREGVYVGYRYYDAKEMDVLFPFGHGLSYTQFTYSNLRLDRTEMQDTDTVKVTLDIQNVGSVAGKEIVQLYVRPLTGEVPRPIRELKGFDKVSLAPGETKQVTFALSKRAFAYYNTTLHDWHVETAQYEIQVGASSRDIRLTAEIGVASTVEVAGVFTRYSSIEQILKTAKGQAILGPVLRNLPFSEELANAGSAPGGSDEDALHMTMMRMVMMQAPLNTLVDFGQITREQVEQLVAAINYEPV